MLVKEEEIREVFTDHILDDNLNISEEKQTFDCNICKDEDDFCSFHQGIAGQIIKSQKIHCSECNQPIPFHLLRGIFYQIIESEAIFKLLVTGKKTGKSLNLALFQAWYIMNHKQGRFVWIYRNEKDLLEKGKTNWEDVIQIHLPSKKEFGIIPNFSLPEWKDSRGKVATGKGVEYNGERRIIFYSLQEWEKSDSSFSGDAIHYVFDEAMASDERYLNNPREEARWGQIFTNIARKGQNPTECYFLANPHTKGIWWLERYTRPDWVKEAFSQDKEEHYYEGEVAIKLSEGGEYQKGHCLLYQSPEKRGKFSWIADTVKNPMRHKAGTFPEDVSKYINLARPKKFKQLYLIKDCVYARELKQKVIQHRRFIYQKTDEETLDQNILHVCFNTKEYNDSECKNKFLIDSTKEMKHWIINVLFLCLESKDNPLFFTNPNAYEAKATILDLIYTNSKNFDKS